MMRDKDDAVNGADERHMNDSTLPPSERVPNKSKSTKTPKATTSASVKVRRNKVGIRKGFGLSDWVRLAKVSKDLAQLKGQPLRKITKQEIKLHNSVHDGWISLHGKVYNIGPYLHYHPGGVDIFKPCLGRDATALFEKYHQWVNFDSLIGTLLIGYLDDSKTNEEEDVNRQYLPQQHVSSDGFAIPAPRPPKASMPSALTALKNDEDEEDDLNPWERNG